jgi:hypothetical protein
MVVRLIVEFDILCSSTCNCWNQLTRFQCGKEALLSRSKLPTVLRITACSSGRSSSWKPAACSGSVEASTELSTRLNKPDGSLTC